MESIAKIQWRCRRGTKELDYLLEGFFHKQFVSISKEEQALFVELLNLQDSQLISFFLGDQLPSSKGLSQLVKKIRKNSDISD